jgi:hypothetical protein
LLNKKSGKSPGGVCCERVRVCVRADVVLNERSFVGRGLFVKCVVSFPKTDPLTSELAITEEVAQ